MTAFDNMIVISILLFLGLVIWTKVQNQRMLDTMLEIKEIITRGNESE